MQLSSDTHSTGDVNMVINSASVAIASEEIRFETGGAPVACPFCDGYGLVKSYWRHQKRIRSKYNQLKKRYAQRVGEDIFAATCRKAIKAAEDLGSRRPLVELRFKRVRCPLCAGWRNIDPAFSSAYSLFVTSGFSVDAAVEQMRAVLPDLIPLPPPRCITKALRHSERRVPSKCLRDWNFQSCLRFSR